MVYKGVFFLITFALVFVLGEDKKWVWEKNSRNAALQDDKPRPRYEIFEPDANYDYDRPLNPIRPNFARPSLNRPQRPLRPVDLGAGLDGPGLNYYPPNSNIDPGFNGNLNGIPGHGTHGKPLFKKFDTCSCTERFNCQSPGLSYGHCDVRKSYCCYNKHGQVDIGPSPSRPIQSPANGVLVGPPNGGDFGYGHHNSENRPYVPYRYPGSYQNYPERPGYGGYIRPSGVGHGQGILVGPGGPTGIIGRPGLEERPYNQPPGGIGFFGRSAINEDNDKDTKSNDHRR